MFRQLGLIGCGLMGGSFALALKNAGLVEKVVGYSASAATRERALAMGVIDAVAPNAADAASGSDLVLLAMPVAAIEATLRDIQPRIHPGMLVMDVGSTKRDVVAACESALREQQGCFVPAHPMAGREVSGVAHADAALYQDRLVILTPTRYTQPESLARAVDVWRAIGCRVVQMSPAQHDAALAAVSHLPHLLAFAFINSVTTQTQAADSLAVAGPGFRDFSRIAASEPRMWHDILLANRDEILNQTRQFRASLDRLEQALSQSDGTGLHGLIAQASAARAAWRLGPAEP
jgi:prephenate dehydrogenase